jgi:hypothetical protein
MILKIQTNKQEQHLNIKNGIPILKNNNNIINLHNSLLNTKKFLYKLHRKNETIINNNKDEIETNPPRPCSWTVHVHCLKWRSWVLFGVGTSWGRMLIRGRRLLYRHLRFYLLMHDLIANFCSLCKAVTHNTKPKNG